MKVLNLNISNHWNEEAAFGVVIPVMLIVGCAVILSMIFTSMSDSKNDQIYELKRLELYYQHCGPNCLPPKQALAGGA